MEIAYRDILLRDRREQDIADWIRWNTVQTQWTQWDAPWEAEESDAARDPAAYRTEQLARLSNPAPEPRVTMELETEASTLDGCPHTGWIATVIGLPGMHYVQGRRRFLFWGWIFVRAVFGAGVWESGL